ncbi:hypothetical protein [Clostridium tyrobutyricum]|uniref:hypothetical protein n=1 Tax=Clostridium tyrobutyricum TaxID=1519 RepID=UPI001C3DCD9C|nr:hypothetical protein [Clostridium tyrobutyricum]MBV4436240.1 hypothetical protein [Clostridium tyrobutyricum]
MKIKISDQEHVFTYDDAENINIKQDKHNENYSKIWVLRKLINPITKNIKYILESEENVPMYGDTTIHRLAEFIVTDETIDWNSLYVEKALKVDTCEN